MKKQDAKKKKKYKKKQREKLVQSFEGVYLI